MRSKNNARSVLTNYNPHRGVFCFSTLHLNCIGLKCLVFCVELISVRVLKLCENTKNNKDAYPGSNEVVNKNPKKKIQNFDF